MTSSDWLDDTGLVQNGLGQTRLGPPGAWSAAAPAISTSAVRDRVDLAAYERLLDAVTVERSS